MTWTIWKASLQVQDMQVVDMPRGAQILYVREQGGVPCVWFWCDTKQPKEPRLIATIGTGHDAPIPGEGRYLGSYFVRDGQYVFHVFEPIKPTAALTPTGKTDVI
jgi:hypothetical protein